MQVATQTLRIFFPAASAGRYQRKWLNLKITLFPALAFVVCDSLTADLFDNIAELLDFGNQSVDVLLRNLEIGVVARFDISALQQVEQPFLLLRVARESLENIRRVFFRGIHQLRQVMALVAVENKGQRNYTQ